MNIIKGFKFTMLATVLILIAVLMPSVGGESTIEIPHLDKLVHAGMFAVLTGCFYIEYLMYKNKSPNILYVLISIIAFAGLTEVLQSFTPTRTMDIWDLVADFIGSIIAIVIIKLWQIKNHS